MVVAKNGAVVEFDPKRVRYLTENFTGLQSLNLVFLGTFYLLWAMEDVYGVSWPIRGWWWSVVCTAIFGAMWYMPRYYLQRFGYVEPKNPSNGQVVVFVSVLLLIFFCRHSLDRYANYLTRVIRSMIPDPNGQVRLLPVSLWIVGLAISILQGSHRLIERFYFLCAGTIAFAAVALYPHWHPEAMEALLWKTLNAGSFGLTLIAVGLFDHISLVRMLPKNVGSSDDE